MDYSTTKNYYKVGFIKRAHGLKGGVTAVPDQHLPVDWELLESVMVEQKGRLVPHFIEDISIRPDKLFIKFEDVDTPEDAEALKGCSLYMPKEARIELEDGDFYSDEVIGFEVADKTLGIVGIVKEVEQAGPNRFFLLDHNGKEVMIPAYPPVLVEISNSTKRIIVDLPEGLLDI